VVRKFNSMIKSVRAVWSYH